MKTLLVFVALLGAGWWLVPRKVPPAPVSHVLSTFGGPGTADGQFNTPRGVAWDGKGTCYVLDLTDRVQAFDVATGKFLRLWRLPGIRKGRPERIAVAPDGSLYIGDTHYGRVLHYDPQGKLLGDFGSEGREPGQMHYPLALCFLKDGRLALTEYGGHDRVQFFTLEEGKGAFLSTFGKGGTAPGEFMRPQGIVQGPDGLLYVADAANQRIQVLTLEGRLVRVFGEDRLSYPYDIAFDPKGRLLVLEYGSHRLSLWTPEGGWLGDLGGLGEAPGKLSNPWGLCSLDDGTLLITNSMNHRIERWRLPD